MHPLDNILEYEINDYRITAKKGIHIIGSMDYTIIGDGTVHLSGIYVHNDWRNKGIAMQMNKKLIEHLTEAKEDFLVIAKTYSEHIEKILKKLEFKFHDFGNYKLFFKRF